MKITDQTLQQIDRIIKKIADKFPASHEAMLLTDIHLCVSPETGELLVLDDDDKEITRCVIEQWIDEKDDDFYEQVATVLRKQLRSHEELIESMSLLKPYSFVLVDDDCETVSELLLMDDEDTLLIDETLMKGLDEDLNQFLADLLK